MFRSCGPCGSSVMLAVGAEHTTVSGLPFSRENGFRVSARKAFRPGSVSAIKDPSGGEGGRPDLLQVFKYPVFNFLEQVAKNPLNELSKETIFMRRRCGGLSYLCAGCGPCGSSVMLAVGANNTYDKRFTAPDMGGLTLYTVLCREYVENTIPVRGISAGRLVAVLLAPGSFLFSALTRLCNKKAVVMLCRGFGVPARLPVRGGL